MKGQVIMIKFDSTNVVGFESAIRIIHNSSKSLEKSDSIKCYANSSCPGICRDNASGICIGPKDLDLLTHICYNGLHRSKILQGITVCVNITAPLYWWRVFSDYKVGKVDYSSMIFMVPKIVDKEFTIYDFSCEHLMSFDNSNYWEEDCDNACFIDTYKKGVVVPKSLILNYIIPMLNVARNKYNEESEKLKDVNLTAAEIVRAKAQQKRFLWQIIQLLPSSYNQRRTVMLNYKVLANIYKSHNNYELDEWRDFCNWIESLPYSELITINEKPIQCPDFLLR